MATAANWADLINNGKMNGTALSSAVKSDANVIAKGAPDVELWANSWNSASNGFTTTITPSQNATGYQVNGSYSLTISTADKNKANYSLYVPHTRDVDSCSGYWLASPSDISADYVLDVSRDGGVYYGIYSNNYFAFRPVVCLPSSVVNQ